MLSEIFSTVLPETSSHEIKTLYKGHGIMFSADVKSDPRIMWTLPELEHCSRTYITMSTFFGRRRQRRYIRHILGIVNDFDFKPENYHSVDDVLDLYRFAGLPLPEIIIATATPGHYQAFNIFPEPLRAKGDLVVAKLAKVHALMAERLGADIQAVGAERWVRRPSEFNILYQDQFCRTSWESLCAWYDAHKPVVKSIPKKKKGVIRGFILDTPAGELLQKPLAVRGQRDEWCYGLGLCLYDANEPPEEIHRRLHEWNRAIAEPLPHRRIETIFRSVMRGTHHASPYVIESLTDRSARVKGWYHFAKKRDRRDRDHLTEVREDILADLSAYGEITETQKAWADRLGVAYRTLKLVLADLRNEGIVEASIGRGRYTQSSYCLSQAYLELLASASNLKAAAGAEGMYFNGNLKGHTAISPSKGTWLRASHHVGIPLAIRTNLNSILLLPSLDPGRSSPVFTLSGASLRPDPSKDSS